MTHNIEPMKDAFVMRNPDPLCDEHEQPLLLLECIAFEIGKFLIPARSGMMDTSSATHYNTLLRDFKLQRQYVRDMFSYEMEDMRSCITRPEPPQLELQYDTTHLTLNAPHL